MVAWPPTLPQKQFLGLRDERQSGRLRTSMDTGPAKQRRRFTAATRNIGVPIVLDGAQRQTFDTFFITTLEEGVLSFDWEDPVDDTTISMRFISFPPFELISGGIPDERMWQAVMTLEILP